MTSNAESKEIKLDTIRHNLRRLNPYLNDSKLTDIFCSCEGKVSIKRFGQSISNTPTVLTTSDRFQLLNQIAKYMEISINFYDYPVLEATIPVPEWKNARITGIFPPWLSEPSFTIRKPPERIYTLEEYKSNNQLSPEHYDLIIDYIKHKKNIIIAGSTGSGKTTLANALLKKKTEFFPRARYYIVQDISELQCQAEYKEMPIVRSDQAIKAVLLSLRYTPDVIIFGEIRKGNVMAEVLDAWNTGHPGGMTTMHANSPKLTITRINKLLLDHYNGNHAALPDLNEYIDLIVYIQINPETGIKVTDLMEMKKIKLDTILYDDVALVPDDISTNG